MSNGALFPLPYENTKAMQIPLSFELTVLFTQRRVVFSSQTLSCNQNKVPSSPPFAGAPLCVLYMQESYPVLGVSGSGPSGDKVCAGVQSRSAIKKLMGLIKPHWHNVCFSLRRLSVEGS